MRSLLILTVLAFGGSAFGANLIVNGDFETTDGRTGLVFGRALNNLGAGQWDVFNVLPGTWTMLSGRGIEVQTTGTVGGVSAHSGRLYVELDSHPNNTNSGSTNSSMFQTVNFTPGFYALSFYYRPRTGTTNDNGIQVRVGANTLNVSETTGTQNGWALKTMNFSIQSAGNQDVIFEATGIANQLGGFVDTVSLVKDRDIPTNENVPEPGTYALVGGALLGVGLLRRKR